MNRQINKLPEILWLVAGILAFAAAIHKLSAAGKYHVQYFIISALSIIMYLYRRHKRKNQ